MSKTISFVASDELAEFLEKESERRMTTISSTAQMLLAEHVRGIRDDRASDESETNSNGADEREEPREERSEPSEPENQEEEESEEEREPDPADEIFELHEDRWYVPSSNRVDYAVRKANGEIQYYKTKEGAAARLAEEYGADGIDVDMTAIQGGNYGQ